MAIFVSTYINKVDRKGRVSVPAQWRPGLIADHFSGVVCFPSFTLTCLEGLDIRRLEQMAERLDGLDMFSEEQDSMAQLIFAAAKQLSFDGEGRIVLPEDFLHMAGVATHAAFVGRGKTFQIWEPTALKAHARAIREKAARRRPTLTPGGDAP